MSISIEKRAFLERLVIAVEKSFDISDGDKQIAEEASLRFEYAIKSLNEATEHLDNIYRPFAKHDRVSTRSIIKGRGVLNRFRQASKDKFEKFKTRVVLAIQKLNYFSNGDADIQELITAFEQGAETVEEKVEAFYEALVDLESENFKDQVIKTIDEIKVEADELDELVNERIIDHIDTNLIGKSWMSETSDRLNIEFAEHLPLVTELFEERKEMLQGGAMPSPRKQQQALNPGDAQKAYYPDHIRTMNIGEFGE